MEKYFKAIRAAQSVDQLEELGELYMYEWADLTDDEFDKIAIELSIAEEKILIINAARLN